MSRPEWIEDAANESVMNRGLLSAICSAIVGIAFCGLCALTLASVIGL